MLDNYKHLVLGVRMLPGLAPVPGLPNAREVSKGDGGVGDGEEGLEVPSTAGETVALFLCGIVHVHPPFLMVG